MNMYHIKKSQSITHLNSKASISLPNLETTNLSFCNIRNALIAFPIQPFKWTMNQTSSISLIYNSYKLSLIYRTQQRIYHLHMHHQFCITSTVTVYHSYTINSAYNLILLYLTFSCNILSEGTRAYKDITSAVTIYHL